MKEPAYSYILLTAKAAKQDKIEGYESEL